MRPRGSRGSSLALRPPLQLGETVHRLQRREAVEVERLEVAEQRIRRRVGEEWELARVPLERRRGARDHAVLSLERAQNLPGAPYYRGRKSGELGHVDAVGAVGAAGLQAMEEDHAVAALPDRHVVVARVLEPLRQLH